MTGPVASTRNHKVTKIEYEERRVRLRNVLESRRAKSVNDQEIAQSAAKDNINDGDFDNQVKVSGEYRLELL